MNVFEPENYPEGIPRTLTAGSFWAWVRKDLSEYGVGYTLKYNLTLHGGATPVVLTATYSGTTYTVTSTATATADVTAGDYSFTVTMTQDSTGNRVELTHGTVTVAANPADSTVDPREHARKVLASIEAVIEKRATKDQESYAIDNRSLSRTPVAELLALRSQYQNEVERLDNAEKIRRGQSTGRTVVVRMR